MATSTANIALGFGRIYIAPYDSASVEALPADGTAKDGSWGGNWVELGYTKEISWKISDERKSVEVDQSTMGVRDYVIGQSVEVEATLVEATLANLKYVLGHGTLSTSGSTAVLSGSHNATLTEYTIGIEYQAPNAVAAAGRLQLIRCSGMPDVEGAVKRDEERTFKAAFKAMPHTDGTVYEFRDYTA